MRVLSKKVFRNWRPSKFVHSRVNTLVVSNELPARLHKHRDPPRSLPPITRANDESRPVLHNWSLFFFPISLSFFLLLFLEKTGRSFYRPVLFFASHLMNLIRETSNPIEILLLYIRRNCRQWWHFMAFCTLILVASRNTIVSRGLIRTEYVYTEKQHRFFRLMQIDLLIDPVSLMAHWCYY